MQNDLKKNITDTFNELNDILFAFNDEQLNKIPFEGSWTGGQTAEHILKALDGIPELMSEAVEAPGRDPGEKVKALEDLFLNFTIKMQAPEFVYPMGQHHAKDELLSELKKRENELQEAIKQDLSLLCMGYEFPTFGYFTRLEWVHFFLVHTQRHTQQLKNIFNSVK